MKRSPIPYFKKLHIDEQFELLKSYGSLIMQAEFEKYYSLLYSVEDWYAEISILKTDINSAKFNVMSLDELLEYYLGWIELPYFDGIRLS